MGSWETAGSMSDTRLSHTLTLLPSGKVLVVGGRGGGGALATAELFEPSDGSWRPAGSLRDPRHKHTATLLPSGKVLVTGGETHGTDSLASAEIYDPRTGAWEMADSLTTARWGHTATLLPSGKVLVAGGWGYGAEIYDPQTDAWQSAGSMEIPRRGHTATLLRSGKVLVSGGYSFIGTHANAEIYDPANESWLGTEDLEVARYAHSATSLPDGRVLVAGGLAVSGVTPTVEIYDPDVGSWTPAALLATARGWHSAALLPSGRVLIVGGGPHYLEPLSSTEIYDPQTDGWAQAAPLAAPRSYAGATLLSSGHMLVAGGSGLSSTEIFDPGAGAWASTEPLINARQWHTATLLPSGKVLVAGGWDFGWLATAELYDPQSASWVEADPLTTARESHSATLMGSGEVLVIGGTTEPSAEIYDPLADAWRAASPPLYSRSDGHTTNVLPSGEVLVTGGYIPGGFPNLALTEIYDPMSDSWFETGAPATLRGEHTATLLPSGKVLIAGGRPSGGNSAELYDPANGDWSPTGSMTASRHGHSATLLPSGRVLVAGGSQDQAVSSAELYDPQTSIWTSTGPLVEDRKNHSATLLPSGRVLVVAGDENRTGGSAVASVEIYDPATGTWQSTAPLSSVRTRHTATLLPSGKVLISAGHNSANITTTAELYDPTAAPDERRPVITSAPTTISYGEPVVITGNGFRGDSEASSGNNQSSAVDVPLVRLQAIEGDHLRWLRRHPADPSADFWNDSMTLEIDDLSPGLDPGFYLLAVTASGVASESKMVELLCSLAITMQPASQTVAIDSTATFSVETQGGRDYQWQQSADQVSYVDIPGATGASYTTPPVTAADSGTAYRVVIANGCTQEVSAPAVLTAEDDEAPAATVVAPSGGEYWQLSSSEIVTWSMSDNVRVCRVEVSLEFSNDGGTDYFPAPAGGGLPAVFEPDGPCVHPGESTTSLEYAVPAEPPSGSPGSLYRVRVRVTDHAGGWTEELSANPFYIVQPSDSAKTLILANVERMQEKMVFSDELKEALEAKLGELAGHPRVQGLVVDLGIVDGLAGLYAAWDQSPADAGLANDVLFAPGGLNDYLQNEILPSYVEVESLLLVGDDRILPMARLPDGGTLLTEDSYTDPDTGDLTAAGTTVGAALAAGYYLSDDPLAMRERVAPADLGTDLFIPDLAVGRLVETPEEMIGAIATFISQGGLLDLTELDPVNDHRVLVTGYDFLDDSASRIRARWKNAYGLEPPHNNDSLAPVDGQLIGPGWTGDHEAELLTHLCGHGGESYGVMSLNGHATHYQEGVPGFDFFTIRGLATDEMVAADACEPGPLELAGRVVYAVGCHGGLPVAGSTAPTGDHPLDLPQALLSLGVQAYAANTGYGWGLRHGVGYSERLVEIFSQEMTAGDTVTVGRAVQRSKRRYFLETLRRDPYAVKTLMQWTLFGFPMVEVRTGVVEGETAGLEGPAPKAAELPAVERRHGLTITRRLSGSAAAASGLPGKSSLPPYMSRLEMSVDFGPVTYAKHGARGEVLPDDGSGCGDPDGCYYTLNGLATAVSDLPILPYTVFDSRLAATSQHGVLWLGGSYDQQEGWAPVIAELISNGAAGSDHGSLPRHVLLRPTGRRIVPGEDPAQCRPSDLELNSLVLPAGEVLKPAGSEVYSVERHYREIDVEVFYLNDTGTGSGNCDRSGPLFGAGPLHSVEGSTVHWTVPVTDQDAEVWRVVVVYNDGTVDQDGRGAWVPLELMPGGQPDTWEASLSLAGTESFTYVVQAVDVRGNVSWDEFESFSPPSSGVAPRLPDPVDVPLDPVWTCLSIPGFSCAAAGSGGIEDSLFDPDPDNNTSAVSTAVAIFRDGFESGNTVAWSQAVPGPPVTILLRDAAPDDPGLYRGSFLLVPSAVELGASGSRSLHVVDEPSGRVLIVLELERRGAGYGLLVGVLLEGGEVAETDPVELTGAAHRIQLEWHGGVPPDESFEIWIDGRMVLPWRLWETGISRADPGGPENPG